MTKTKMMKIEELEMPEEMYPRTHVAWDVAFKYQKCMEVGNKFPPIVVGTLGKRKIVVDGWHRLQATTNKKEKYISAIEKKYKSMNEIYIDAVRLNSLHGKPFSTQERLTIAGNLEKIGITKADIQKIVGMKSADIKRFMDGRSVTTLNGEQVILKNPLEYAKNAIQNAIDSGVDINELQKTVTGSSPKLVLNDMLTMLKTNAFDMTNPQIEKQMIQVCKLINKKIPITKRLF